MSATDKQLRSNLKRLIPFVVLLLAFLAYTTTIDYQSFWTDEFQAFDFINRPFRETASMLVNPENNGPLFYVLLWAWNRLVGPSDLAIRFMSDLFMILALALLWRLAKTWFKRPIANIAICIMAAGPFTLWFAQEAKMYALHMMLATLSTLFLTRAIKSGKWYRWLAYGVALNLVGYSHFFGAYTIAAQGLLVLLTTWKEWKTLRSYFVTMCLIALPYIPVVLYVLRILPSFEVQDNSKGFVEFPHVIQELVSIYTLATPRTYVLFIKPLVWVTIIGFFGGLVYALYQQRNKGLRNTGIWLSGLTILPVAMYYVGSLFIPVFSAKYLSAIYPLFILSLSMLVYGARKLFKPIGTVVFAAILIFAMWGNFRIFTQPALQRSDWRLVANYIETHAGSNDVIICYADYVHRGLLRYYDGQVPVKRFKAKPYEPQEYYQDQQALGYDRMWLVLHHDQVMAPQNKLQEMAGVLYPNITAVYPNYGNIALLGYSMRWDFREVPTNAQSVTDGTFENGVSLVGYQVDTTTLPPDETLLHPPSNWIHTTTFWKRTGDVTSDAFTPFVHMIDDSGGIWGAELQRVPTVWHRTPSSTWADDAVIEIHYDINLNPDTPPGTYTLVLGLTRDGEAKAPIHTVGGAPVVTLTEINITP